MNKRITELTRRFQEIGYLHMSGLPIYNHDLEVECIGFQPFHHGWIGSLITPWFINIIYINGDKADWTSLTTSQKYACKLPSGKREFVAGEDERIGKYLFISVASPTLRFKTQEAARRVALHALDDLMSPPSANDTPGVPVKFKHGTNKSAA